MSKAIMGAVLIAGSAAALTILTGGLALPGILALSNTTLDVLGSVALAGVSMEAGAIASAFSSNRGINISSRQTAAYRQIIYGVQRVGGVIVYRNPSGSTNRQLNYIIVVAGHKCNAIQGMYLDGRAVRWQVGSVGNSTHNGSNFGGSADGGTYTGPNGKQYNFGGKVYAQAYYGDQTNQPNTLPGGGYDTGCHANSPGWGPSVRGIPYLGGCTYVYVKIEYDPSLFPGEPEIRFTVEGKDDIYDPRTGTSGFTSNCALICADILTNTTFGLGDTGAVNEAQLIAAANICDEKVPLAAGGSELRYPAHYHYDTSTASGDALLTLLGSMGGRLSLIGGEWYLWPAAFTGSSAHFDESIFTGSVQWEPKRSFAELFNKVTGTYVAPNYPYSVSGNFYDGNGFNNGEVQDNFGYAWQPTNYPEYACNPDHGYAADEYLIEDRNIVLRKEVSRPACLSAGQAQRLAKIDLLRNRQQGHGVFQMGLAAFQLQPNDTFTVTFPAMGWTNKLFEVVSVTTKFGTGSNGAPLINLEVVVQETDASVYEWTPLTDERAVNDQNIILTPSSYLPVAPENLTLTSSAATALTGADGIVRPRVMVSWDTPQDAFATQVQVQYQSTVAGATWLEAGLVDVALNSTYIGGVIAGAEYNFRIRSLRPNGATSPWVESDAYTVSNTLSQVTSTGMNPNSAAKNTDNSKVDSIAENAAATVRVYGPGGDGSSWNLYIGGVNAVPESAAHITGLAFTTLYYVFLNTRTGTLATSTNRLDSLADSCYPLGSCVTCSSTYDGGGGGGGGTGGGGGRNPIIQQQQPPGDSGQ